MPERIDTCIYCGIAFDPTAGDGDHIFPAALGEFSGFDVFRGACTQCNNRIGQSEEELIRCGPEAYLARMSDPPRRRARDGTGWPGAKTAPAPAMFNERYGAKLVVQPVTRDPRNTETVNQLVVQDAKGEQFPIKIFPGMSAEAIRAKIKALNIDGKFNVHFNVSEENSEWFNRVQEELWPGAKVKELPPTEVGVHRVQGLLRFTVTDHYFRALVKMAFHYYLRHNTGGIRGDEPEFANVRRFILDGGDRDQFFKSAKDAPVSFDSPFGDLPGGGMMGPPGWGHMFAADDSTGTVVVFLHLFLGPGYVLPPYYVVLGTRPTSKAATGPWSHLLRWEPGGPKGTTQPLMLARGDWPQTITGPGLENLDPRSWRGHVL